MLAQDASGDSVLDHGLASVAQKTLSDPAPLISKELGPYRILRLLGEGGMGVVYLAERKDLDTQVATLRANQNALALTQAIAPFDGVVTNEPVREGETVVEGIQKVHDGLAVKATRVPLETPAPGPGMPAPNPSGR